VGVIAARIIRIAFVVKLDITTQEGVLAA